MYNKKIDKDSEAKGSKYFKNGMIKRAT